MKTRGIFYLILLTAAAGTAAIKICKGGAECIELESCTGLYNNLLLGGTPYLAKLAKNLHCGFNGFNPKVCCPPEFRTTPGMLSRDGFSPDGTGDNSNTTVSDRQICGIETADKTMAQQPWTALLRYEKTIGWGFFCGGVLISSKHVLTTASCVKGQDLPSNWKLSQVRLGEWNTNSITECNSEECNESPIDVPIQYSIVHENYDPNDKNQYDDIALLLLARQVQFTDYIKPICLPSPDQTTSTLQNYVARVAGWGEIESHHKSEFKIVSDVPIISASECSDIFERNISEKQMCAGGSQVSDSCLGDYGGALTGRLSMDSNWIALGLASYRPVSCSSPEFPTVYTRVDAYIEWIDEKMAL